MFDSWLLQKKSYVYDKAGTDINKSIYFSGHLSLRYVRTYRQTQQRDCCFIPTHHYSAYLCRPCVGHSYQNDLDIEANKKDSPASCSAFLFLLPFVAVVASLSKATTTTPDNHKLLPGFWPRKKKKRRENRFFPAVEIQKASLSYTFLQSISVSIRVREYVCLSVSVRCFFLIGA